MGNSIAVAPAVGRPSRWLGRGAFSGASGRPWRALAARVMRGAWLLGSTYWVTAPAKKRPACAGLSVPFGQMYCVCLSANATSLWTRVDGCKLKRSHRAVKKAVESTGCLGFKGFRRPGGVLGFSIHLRQIAHGVDEALAAYGPDHCTLDGREAVIRHPWGWRTASIQWPQAVPVDRLDHVGLGPAGRCVPVPDKVGQLGTLQTDMQSSGLARFPGIVVAVLRGADGNDQILALVVSKDDNGTGLLDLVGNRALELGSGVLGSAIGPSHDRRSVRVQEWAVSAEKTFVNLAALDSGIHCRTLSGSPGL